MSEHRPGTGDEPDPTGVRELLSGLPDPGPMPDDVAARISARLRAEQEQSGAPGESAGAGGSTEREAAGVHAPSTHPGGGGSQDDGSTQDRDGAALVVPLTGGQGTSGSGPARRTRSSAPRWIGGLAAAAALVLGGGLAIQQLGDGGDAAVSGDAAEAPSAQAAPSTATTSAAEPEAPEGAADEGLSTATGSSTTGSSTTKGSSTSAVPQSTDRYYAMSHDFTTAELEDVAAGRRGDLNPDPTISPIGPGSIDCAGPITAATEGTGWDPGTWVQASLDGEPALVVAGGADEPEVRVYDPVTCAERQRIGPG